MTTQELKQEREQKNTELFKQVGLFFAFSNEQFAKNRTELKEGEKYVSIGAGGYLPKGNLQEFKDGLKAIERWYNGEIKDNKLQTREIIYELHNHECFNTGNLESVYDMFEGRFERQVINDVYNKERKKVKVY